jgi:DNA-binding LytR/AlgR family response regulator
MIDFEDTVPEYLTSRKNTFRLIFFTSIFALVFIYIYSPFGFGNWHNLTQWQPFAYWSMAVITGILVVALSRLLMFVIYKSSNLTYLKYGLWIAGEIAFMALFYTLFLKIVLKDASITFDLFRKSLQNTALIILIPYSVLWLYFSWQDKKEQIEMLSQGLTKKDISQNLIPFYDEKNILRISIKMENLLYFEASDNYVNIYYLNKEKVSRFLLRNSLKKLESTFTNSELLRCHRSYMVNFKKVKVLRKEKDGLCLEMDTHESVDLPVSKTYVERVMNTFMNYSKVSQQ